MRITHISVKNFCSYPELEFSLTNQGLTLISGPNGSGKSTLCDAIPWVLFGVTAKGGKVDDVCSWNSKGTTEGTIKFDNGLAISRSRTPNDLYFADLGTTSGSVPIRGRDLADTQKIINQKLGMNADLFLSGSYFHEFCQSAKFFTASAKDRRVITEQIADLSLSNKIYEGAAKHKKDIQELLQSTNNSILKYTTSVNHLEQQLISDTKKRDDWEIWHKADTQATKDKIEKFEENKTKAIQNIKESTIKKVTILRHDIDALQRELVPDNSYAEQLEALKVQELSLKEEKCSECGAPKDVQKRLLLTKKRHELDLQIASNERKKIDIQTLEERIKVIEENGKDQLEKEVAAESLYELQLKTLESQTNPHSISGVEMLLKDNKDFLQEARQLHDDCKVELADIDLILEINDRMRMAIISRAAKELETNTNEIFEDFFAGEIRVAFSTEASDKIEIDIMKDGNQATYTQLSKGQRAMLKLAFGTSVMKTVANHHGLSFNVLMFDESLDGLSEASKEQAYKLFTKLEKEYETIIIIDHSEKLKPMVSNQYEVIATNGHSRIHAV